jgi:methionine-rich copper-binding protein CopC
MVRREVFWPALAVAFVACAAFGPRDALAHAEYDRSTPGRDEVVATPPAQVDVWFTQEVFKQEGRNFIRVFDGSDLQVSEGDGIVDDDDRHHIFATIPTSLPEGRYIVEWMTTSDEDGDTDEGAFCFYVVVQPTAEQAAECAAFAEEEEPTATPPPQETLVEPTAIATEVPTAEPIDSVGDDDDGGSGAAIVGGIVGVIAAVIVLGGAFLIWQRRRAA